MSKGLRLRSRLSVTVSDFKYVNPSLQFRERERPDACWKPQKMAMLPGNNP